MTLLCILFIWTVICFLLVFLPCAIDIDSYIYIGDDVVWVTRNYELNKTITIFFPHIAIMYDNLCEKINGDGLAILIILILLATLPITIVFSILGALFLLIHKSWKHFCKVYARESDEEC